MEIAFRGETVLVTGGTRGIGKSVAEGFARAGADVICTGTDQRQVEELDRLGGSSIRYRWLDFTSGPSVDAFFRDMESWEALHVLVNNAGVNRINPIDDVLDEDWQALMEVNLTGPMLTTRAASRIMKRNGYGRIVNIGSIFGEVSRAKRSVYTTTKYGIRGLTIGSAIDLASHGVLVNCVAPGFVLTDLTLRILSAAERAELEGQVPIGRLAQPEEIVPAILFLASALNTYVTAQTLFVDGGFVNV